MSPYLSKGMFKELKDMFLFKSAKVKFEKVYWENESGRDAEILYEDNIPYSGSNNGLS